jgi:hypothetical protein
VRRRFAPTSSIARVVNGRVKVLVKTPVDESNQEQTTTQETWCHGLNHHLALSNPKFVREACAPEQKGFVRPHRLGGGSLRPEPHWKGRASRRCRAVPRPSRSRQGINHRLPNNRPFCRRSGPCPTLRRPLSHSLYRAPARTRAPFPIFPIHGSTVQRFNDLTLSPGLPRICPTPHATLKPKT